MTTATQRKVTLAQEAKALRRMRERERVAKEKYEALKDEREAAERGLLDRMEMEETESIKCDGTLFVPTTTVYGQVNDRAEFIAWAKDNEPELIEAKERKALVSELVRERLDNGEELPPGVGFYAKQYISLRAA